MALDVICRMGHHYIQADLYPNHYPGSPHCPECYKKWWKKLSKKKKKKVKKYHRKHMRVPALGEHWTSW